MIIAFVFGSSYHPALLYLMAILYPLQGVYNLAIYMYLKILNAKKKSNGDNNITWWKVFVIAFWAKGSESIEEGIERSFTDSLHFSYKTGIFLLKSCRYSLSISLPISLPVSLWQLKLPS